MKQTNSALKFLIAQYRAIFKHAQLASILAIAAAAGLSVGQANATPITTWGDLPGKVVDNTVEVDGSKTSLGIEAAGTETPLTEKFTINITGGANTIDGAAPAKPDQPEPEKKLFGEKVDINITAAADPAADTKLTIGGANGNLGLKVNSVTVSKGSLIVSSDTATAGTSLIANDLTFGSATVKDASATVAIKKLGTVSATNLNIESGAAISVAEEAVLTGTNININDGKVTLGAAGSAPAPRPPAPSPFAGTTKATLGSDSSTVVIADGTVEANDGVLLGQSISMTGSTISNKGTLSIGAKDKTFSATSGTVTNATGAKDLTFESNASFAGGKLDVTAGTVTFNGTATFGKDSFKNAGSVVVMGETTIADDAIAAQGIGQTATLTIGSAAESTTKLSLNAANLKTLTTATTNTITASGDGDNSFAEIHLTDTEGTLNLGNTKSDTNALKILADDTGALTANYVDTNGKFKFSGKAAKFAGTTIDNAAIFAFDSFTGGTKDAGLTVSGGASIAVTDNLTVGDGSGALTVANGTVSLAGAAGAEAKALKAKSVTLGDAGGTEGKLEIASGKWSVTDLTLTSGSATVNGTAELTIKGNLTTSLAGQLVGNDAAIINAKEVGTLKLGAQGVELNNTSVLILDAADVIADGAVIGSAFEAQAVTGSANSTIRILSGSELATFATAADYDKFRKATKFSGLFDVKITDLNAKNEMTFADGANKVQGGVGSGYENTQVLVDGTTETVQDTYSVGNIKLTSGDTVKIDQAGSLTLENSKANGADSLFVSQTSGGKLVAGNVFFTNNVGGDSGLTLEGTGSIGSITTETDGLGALTVGSAESKNGTVTVIGSIGTPKSSASASDEKALASVTVNDGNNLHVQSGSITTETLKTGLNTTIDVGSGDITTDKATVSGNITAGVLTLNSQGQTHSFDGNAVVDVNKLVLDGSVKLEIGKDKVGDVKGSSAQIFSDVLLVGAGSSIYVDPEYGQQASLLVVGSLSDSQSKPDVETLSGDAYIGKNSAIGIGFTKDGFNDVMADYLTVSGGFNEKGSVKNALVLNTPIKVESGKGIVLDSDASRADLDAKKKPNMIVMGDKTGIVLTDKAFGADKKSAAITFANAAGGFDAVASSNSVTGSQIVLVGDFDANDNALKIAVKNDGSVAGGLNGLTVTAAGGLLKGEYDPNTGTFDMQFQDDKKGEIYAGISSPVGDLIVSKYQGEFSDKKALGYLFLSDVLSENNYKAVDAAAHAATYAGAQQAAVAAVGTMAEAVGGRVGTMGVEAASISATGTQANGGVWLTPMYKSVDADEFNAQGGSYGADVDLAGVAFGADTVNGNMRFGAVFNIGSGDADGKGNGNGLKDEFDYYGFGIYSVMGFGNLALVGDASLNVISHDVEAAGLGVKGSADTTAVTMGVTGQYTIAFPMVDVVPHLGVRFTRLDTDSYDLSSAKGVIASTDFEVQNVVSIPLGVSISKAMEMGGWSLAPSADFSITFNTGDTEAESSTYFTGTRAISMTTEVLDEVTYGVAVGLGAQYGAFGTNIGINYTGSENTDSFGVNAQARYMF